jgi:orotidine-5'-phosphate decarboxylase
MKAYMQLMFDDIKADAVVINPYMGDDVFEPFMLDGHKTAIVLVQTSNPQAKIVQEQALTNGKKLWEEILSLTIHRWNKKNNLMVVLSSNTALQDYQHIRAQIPQDMPILLAGIGAQGGNPEIMKQLLNKEKRGVFVNSSRGILYPYTIQDVQWEEKVLSAVIDLKNTLNAIRDGSC